MTAELQGVLIFTSAFAQVFLLGLNSKLLRDDKIAAGFVVSWMITLAQFGYIWAVAHSRIDTVPFLVISGFGGSIGITSAQYFYRWYDKTFHRKRGERMSDVKPTNPKDLIGSGKLPLHLWPTTATAMGCIGLLEGMLKYGRSNWREAGVRASIYVDACKRHLDAWFEGEECAPDSGSPHLANALACLAILVDAKAAGKLVDDRQYNGSGYRELVESLTPQVAHLKGLFSDKAPKHYTIADNAQEQA